MARLRLAVIMTLGLILAACGSVGRVEVTGVVTAGPTCPTVTDASAAPSCGPLLMEGVHLTIIRVADSLVVAQPVTDAIGAFSVRLDPGRYWVHGEWVYGTTPPSPVFFDVTSSGAPPVTLKYDTGIR